MRISILVSILAWLSVFILGGLAAARAILVDGLLIGYWIFCYLMAMISGAFAWASKIDEERK